MIYLLILNLHFIFDWILQDRSVAKSKKEFNDMLAVHILTNILPFSAIIWIILSIWSRQTLDSFLLVFFNFISHTIIDKYLPSGKTEREMINWTAIDQMLHISILIILIETIL